MYERVLKTEFPGVKMIELNGCIQAFMWTKKPVKTLEDVKGLKIRSPGGHQTITSRPSCRADLHALGRRLTWAWKQGRSTHCHLPTVHHVLQAL